MLNGRLAGLPRVAGPRSGLEIRAARTATARLLGLAFLPELAPRTGLLLPHTRSVHTLGMRFALDLVWLDRRGRVVRVDHGVPPRRVRCCLRASSVVELAAGEAAACGLRPAE